MMKSKTYDLAITKSDAYSMLLMLGNSTFGIYDVGWKLSKDMNVGFGETNLYDENQQFVQVGACEFLSSKHKPDDLTFVTMGVSLFHEFRHCQQNLGENIDPYITINLISTVGNNKYYRGNWDQMPYEIDAEYCGVFNMRSALLRYSDVEIVDKCMLDYINFRVENTAHFLPAVKDGYKSIDQVDKAFEQAYKDSILNSRDPQSGLSGYSDEFVRLLRANEGVCSPYYEFFNDFIGDMSGGQKDRMLAAMVFHLHPDLKSWQPVLKSEEISFESEFGKPFPETTEQSRERLGIKDEKTNRKLESVLSQNTVKRAYREIPEFDDMFDTTIEDDVAYDI